MTDQGVAEIIGTHVALTSSLAATWHKVTHGEISPEEAAKQLESPEERENAVRIFTPLTREQQDAMLAALRERLEAEEPAKTSSGDDVVISRPWWRTPPWVITVLAVAAALLLVIFMSRAPSETLELAAGYTLDSLPGHDPYRGDEGAPVGVPTYSLGGTLRATLRADHAVHGPIDARAFARSADGETLRLRLPAKVETNGTVILEANVRGAGLHEGTWALVFAVGRPEALPSSWEELAAAQANDEMIGYEVVGQSIHVVLELVER